VGERGRGSGLRRCLPYITGNQCLDWELDDPAGKSLDETRAIRDRIAARVEQLLIELGEKEPVHDAS
jgi:protein-tyrosine-phosphatase